MTNRIGLASICPLPLLLGALALGGALPHGTPSPPMAAKAFVATTFPSATLPPQAGDEPTTVERSADGLFYVHAQVNGRAVRFLVDTGASVVVLTAADAAAIGVAPHADGYDAHVQTASGKAPMAWANLAEVKLAGREVRGIRAAVMREGLGVSLLGQNMLQQLGSVRIEGDRLELR